MREQLGWYALGHGTPQERAAVRAHLDGCAACRAELAELTPLTARLAGVDPDRLDEQPAPPAGLGDAVLARIAAEAPLRRISEEHRTAIVQTHLRGRPYAEVAAELGVPVGTLRSRVFYGLKALRLALDEMGVEP